MEDTRRTRSGSGSAVSSQENLFRCRSDARILQHAPADVRRDRPSRTKPCADPDAFLALLLDAADSLAECCACAVRSECDSRDGKGRGRVEIGSFAGAAIFGAEPGGRTRQPSSFRLRLTGPRSGIAAACGVETNAQPASSSTLHLLLYLAYVLPRFGPLSRWTHVPLSVPAFTALLWVWWRRSRTPSHKLAWNDPTLYNLFPTGNLCESAKMLSSW